MVRVAGTLLLCLALTETSEQVIAKNVGELEWTTISQNRFIETRCNGPLDGGSIANQARHSPTITCLLC